MRPKRVDKRHDLDGSLVTAGSARLHLWAELGLVHYQETVDGEPVELTAKEFELLAYLARHAGKTCTHQMVFRQVWEKGRPK